MAYKKYMTFNDIKLQQPLSSVKRTEKTNDTLVIPANFLTTMERFFDAEAIELEDPVLFISPFDADALFDWAKQLYGESMDASYQQYLDDQRANLKNTITNTNLNNK